MDITSIPGKVKIQQALLLWFEENQRDMPWRKTRDPYFIWVSEIMLQQTRVDTVVAYYQRFIAKFPTVHELAKAEQSTVLKLWEGLGYYSRARNLHKGAQFVVAHYQGAIPDTYAGLIKVPGIGDYTAGAILSIAYGQAYPAVDGNVLRVLARIFGIGEDIMQMTTRTQMRALAKNLMPKGQSGAFNQALMELGALICAPRSPLCEQCPLHNYCVAFADGTQSLLPVKSPKNKPKEVKRIIFLIVHENRVLIRQRSENLLHGLWEFPGLEWEYSMEAIQAQLTQWGLCAFNMHEGKKSSHVFTHMIWRMQGIWCEVKEPKNPQTDTWRWADVATLEQLAFPTALKVYLQEVKASLKGKT